MDKNDSDCKIPFWLKVLEIIIIPISLAIIGYFVEKANRKNTSLLEQTKIRISQVETFTNYIPYLTSKNNQERVLALEAIFFLFNPTWAIKIGISDTVLYRDFLSHVGEAARKGLTEIKNKTIDQEMQETAQKYLKKLNTKLDFLIISHDRYSTKDYTRFRNGKVYANIRFPEEIKSVSIDWGEKGESWQKIESFDDYYLDADDGYAYSISHQYRKTGNKNIEVKIVTSKGDIYTESSQVMIEAL